MKGVEPARIAEIIFYSEKSRTKVANNPVPQRRAPPTSYSDEEKENFLLSLLAAPSPSIPIGLSLFASTACNFVPKKTAKPVRKLAPGMRHLFKICSSPSDPNELPNIMGKIALTKDEIDHVEEATSLQCHSLVWYEQRAGRITSSEAHSVLHTNQANPASSIIKTVCSDSPRNITTPAITWGREHEAIAKQQYADGTITTEHFDLTVNNCGLCIDQGKTYLAASPDARVSCVCHGSGLLEIKCPYKFKDMSIPEMSLAKDSCLDSDLSLKRNHPYYTQVQHQLYVTGASFCDFLVWLPSGSHVCTVFPDAEYARESVPKLTKFWTSHILPELVSRNLETGSRAAQTEHTHHCSCGSVDAVPMIGCDDANCPHQWYHYECVGIKKTPRASTWYCPMCRSANTKAKRQRKR